MSMGSARCSLIAGFRADPAYRHVVLTVADQAADASGLWLADYDLLARMPGLERLDLIATENVLAAGFHERVHDVLPGIEEERWGGCRRSTGDRRPRVSRSRSTAMERVARSRGGTCGGGAIDQARCAGDLERTAVVFQRPLPYLYLARQVFPDAEIPYQALDSLPLAAEPFAAALDLVLSFREYRKRHAERSSSCFDVRTGHLVRRVRHSPPADIAAADGLLRDVKYVGGWDRLLSLAAEAGQSYQFEHGSDSQFDMDACGAGTRRRGERGDGAAWARRCTARIRTARRLTGLHYRPRAPPVAGRRVVRAAFTCARRHPVRARIADRGASAARRRTAAASRAGRDAAPVD